MVFLILCFVCFESTAIINEQTPILFAALFGAYGSGSHLAPGRGSYGGSHGASNNSMQGSGGYGNTLSVAASQAASLGINPASEFSFSICYLLL